MSSPAGTSRASDELPSGSTPILHQLLPQRELKISASLRQPFEHAYLTPTLKLKQVNENVTLLSHPPLDAHSLKKKKSHSLSLQPFPTHNHMPTVALILLILALLSNHLENDPVSGLTLFNVTVA